MKILICAERFLFRFGLDRVLLLIAQALSKRGHEVTIMGCRFDDQVVGQVAQRILKIPPCGDNYINYNNIVSEWLEHEWKNIFPIDQKPEIVIIGGWPFFEAIEVFRKHVQATVFLDAGAVPTDSYVGYALQVQKKLRDLRAGYLQHVTSILAISQFIADSQSSIDRGNSKDVSVVLLGADHMEQELWKAQSLEQKIDTQLDKKIETLRSEGYKLVLNLGRWEPNCYKNSEKSFEIIRYLLPNHKVCLLVLADSESIDIPVDLQNNVSPLGFPDDNTLQKVMGCVQLGICMSDWEGFNLPLAEMQWINKPALVFDTAAHPEVVVHPWFLCANELEMFEKAKCVLDNAIPKNINTNIYKEFQNNFRWANVLQKYCQAIETSKLKTNKVSLPLVIVDTTNSCRDTANSGVVRVTRQLCRVLQGFCNPIFVTWDFDMHTYTLPSELGYQHLARFNGPKHPSHVQQAYWQAPLTLDNFLIDEPYDKCPILFLFAETILDERCGSSIDYVTRRQWSTAAIFYDLLPVSHKQFCSPPVRTSFPKYLEMLSAVDNIISISEASAEALKTYWKNQSVQAKKIKSVLLPGEFGQYSRNNSPLSIKPDLIKILCVSTLEPRKNHISLLKAFEIVAKEYPDLNWELTLVGNLYEGASEVHRTVQVATSKDTRIKWLGVVDDDRLHALYKECTFTVYSSIAEGFGMPILESIWHSRVCVCHFEGVMAELARDGGCVTTNMNHPQAIAQTIYDLARHETLLLDLSYEASKRHLKSWDEYMIQLSNALNLQHIDWQDVLYPRCLTDKWQMHDSERIGLTGMLARHNPYCSIEVGTYHGGSLSLISQYSNMVFSIDIEPVEDRLPSMENVSFLTGNSTELLPKLFQALDEQNIAVNFVLIDGDHSTEGVRRDIEVVLSYVPKQPMFVMFHDSFNPKCRAGILAAPWEDSRYVSWIDIDFVPGRIIQGENNAASGELWGGLALALLTPHPRSKKLVIQESARALYEMANRAAA